MKKNHLALISLLCFACLVVFSCRRELKNMMNDQVVSSTALDAAKNWHVAHLAANTAPNIRLNPQWNNSWMLKTNGVAYLVVPAGEKTLSNKVYEIRRVFIFSMSGNQVSNGEIIEFLGRNYDVSENLDKLISNHSKENIDDFNGRIFEYDVNYRQINSAVYKDGRKLDAKADLISIKATTTVSTRSLATSSLKTNYWVAVEYDDSWPPRDTIFPECTITYDEVDYITNGHVDRIVFEFVSMSCPVPESSGSGSSSAPPPSPPYGGLPGIIEITPSGTPAPTGPLQNPYDDCIQVGMINALFDTPSLQSANTTLSTKTNATREWGADIKRTSTNSGVVSQKTTVPAATEAPPSAGNNKWPIPPFVWRTDAVDYLGGTTGEYTIGYTHTHPSATAPGLDDIMLLITNRNYVPTDVIDQLCYKTEAFVSTVTPSGTYTVMIKDWDSVNGANNAYADYVANPNTLVNNYNLAYSTYLQQHGGGVGDADFDRGLAGEASAYALKAAVPFINVYKAHPSTPNTNKPVENYTDSSNHGQTRPKNC